MTAIEKSPAVSTTAVQKLLCIAVVVFLAAGAIFPVFYLLSGYEALKRWFLSMNDCFYRRAFWAQEFFTPAVKAKGNGYAAAALAICLAGVAYILVRRKKYFNSTPAATQKVSGSREPLFYYIPVVILSVCAWYVGASETSASADEIFSAVNIAELPPFQGMAYYMLPNNHIYFNFINGFLTRITHIDGVLTGRVLSMLGYIGVCCSAYHWFAKRFGSYWWAFVATIPVALQFTVWSFGFQARGYELQLFCGWIALLTLFRYTNTGEGKWLRYNALFSVLGFALIPTYLYYFAAQTVFMLLFQAKGSRMDMRFWKYQAFTIAAVFLLYLPALCFSGKDALTANDYVKTAHATITEFLPRWWVVVKYFLNFVFSFLISEDHPLNFILFCVPLLLVFSRRKDDRWLAVFYIVLWLVWGGICVYMQRWPFSRNMIIHYSITMALTAYTVYTYAALAARGLRNSIINCIVKAVAFAVPTVFLCVHLFLWGRTNARYLLYFMDVNKMQEAYDHEIGNLAPGSSVICTDERYCFYYYARKRGFKVHKCIEGNEDYYIKIWSEPLPDDIAKNYNLVIKCVEGDDIYKRK